jgi:hypothetical protein
MNDIFEKYILHKVFLEKAEKAETLEQKIVFCESFLKKYKKQKVTDAMYQQEYEASFPITNNLVQAGRPIGDRILTVSSNDISRDYSITGSYITSTPKHEIFQAQKITMDDRFLLPEEKVYILEKAKQDLMTEIMNNALKTGYVSYDIQKIYDNDSTSIRCKMGVFKA